MLHYLVRRLLLAASILLGISLVAFLLVSTVEARIGEPDLAALRGLAGPSHSLPARYLRWFSGFSVQPSIGLDSDLSSRCFAAVGLTYTLCDHGGGLLRADLGTSLQTGEPVLGRILAHLPATLLLLAAAIFLGTVVGSFLIWLAVRFRWSGFGRLACWLARLVRNLPALRLGLIAIFLVGVWQGWISPVGSAGDGVKLLLVAAAPAFLWCIILCRAAQNELIEPIRRPPPEALSDGRGLARSMRTVGRGLTAGVGSTLGDLLTTALVSEVLLAWPGIGSLTLQAAAQQDYPVVLGVIMLTSVVVTLGQLLIDCLARLPFPTFRLLADSGAWFRAPRKRVDT